MEEKGHQSSRSGPGKQDHDYRPSMDFVLWLAENRLSVGFSTYQSGIFALVGRQENGKLSVFERFLASPMGMFLKDELLYVASRQTIWRFDNILSPGQLQDGMYDKLFLPKKGTITGYVDIHDLVVDNQDRTVFVNTLCNCLATTSETYSFEVVWKPKFISALVKEDRCHLNGVALKDGRPRFVTCVSQTDVDQGWREHRHDGGCLIDIESDEVIVHGLSMPHSPRYYNDRIWLLNAGTGFFGYVDEDSGEFREVVFCPGFLRGLALHGKYAVAGISRPRHKAFSGLTLDENLKKYKMKAASALVVIDLERGEIAHWLEVTGQMAELYDVIIMPETVRPMAIGFQNDEINRFVQMPLAEAVSVAGNCPRE
jgi:uncharacterized protein (TIGR03032 family)